MSEERKIPSFLCQKSFDDDMMSSFFDFYNKCVAEKAEDAIIYINSPGGYVSILDSMLSLMESAPINFHTVGIVWCCSCGLLAGGDVRYATDRAEIMFHDIASGSHGHPDQMQEDVERIKITSQRVLGKFADKTKKPLKWWIDEYLKKPNREFWFDCKKAKTLGVIDHVGLPLENIKESKAISIEVKK